jgi:hypothetical protein
VLLRDFWESGRGRKGIKYGMSHYAHRRFTPPEIDSDVPGEVVERRVEDRLEGRLPGCAWRPNGAVVSG